MPDLPPMRSVFSSHVSRIGYDAAANALFVTWDSGKTSRYDGVPADLAESVGNAWSIGKALRDSIKGRFPHSYVATPDN